MRDMTPGAYLYNPVDEMEGVKGARLPVGTVRFVLDPVTEIHVSVERGELRLYLSGYGGRMQLAVRHETANNARVAAIHFGEPITQGL